MDVDYDLAGQWVVLSGGEMEEGSRRRTWKMEGGGMVEMG